MFGSNPFGQPSSSSPFGSQSQSMFGQTNSNAFAPKPFGTSTPFGGSSMFGGTSTGVFGAPQASSPFSSTPTFGASSQGFGSSTPAFGASSAPAFGNSPSPFGGTSTFGQNSFGQSSPFGNTTQQSQPAFGNSTFGSSTPFGGSSTPAFGATNTPAFGANTSTPGFGASSTPAFGASSTPAFGASSTPAFGASSSPAFGSTNTPAFGATPTPAFGNSGTGFGNNAFGSGGGNNAFGSGGGNNAFGSGGAFGGSNTPAFGASSAPAFGASSTPSFSFGSSSAFGQPNSALGSTQSPFGGQGAQAPASTFGGQQVGSRVLPYVPTTEADSGSQPPGKLVSISAMTVYKDKSLEELRWEDYQRGDKGGQRPAGQYSGGGGFSVTNSQPMFSPSPTFAQTSANTSSNPFPSTTPTNAFSNPTSTNPFAQKTQTVSPFNQTPSPSIFGSTSSTATSTFGPSPTPQPFASSSNSGFGSSPSFFNSGSTPAFSTGASFNNSQSSPLFTSNSMGQQTSFSFGPNANSGFSQNNNFSTPSTGFGNMFSSSPSLTTTVSSFSQTTSAGLTSSFQLAQPAQPGAFAFNGGGQTQTQPAQPAQPGAFSFNGGGQTQPGTTSFQPAQPGGFGFNGGGQTQPANANGGGTSGLGVFSQRNFGQVSPSPSSVVMQPTPIANPFGTLPASPRMSIAQGGNSPSIQYGISSMPVVDKPAPVRISSLLTSRHLLQRRVKTPARKYRPGDDGPKVAFFSDEENSNTPKADALFIPRENPRALFIRPVEKEKSALPKDSPTPLHENGVTTNGANHSSEYIRTVDKANGETRGSPPVKANNQKPNGTHENHGGDKAGSPSAAEIESVMPKLHHAEYFTEPRIQELAAKERANPGYCKRVRDFVVGRHGYGSIKFLGETDVRKLDLELLVQFNNREVIVYMDESKKPPVGQGLNKPAEVTLLNIKCMDKKSGTHVKEGPRVEKYKEMLKKKAAEQGAQFVSYDAVNGEWKFRVEHFSSYELGDEDDE